MDIYIIYIKIYEGKKNNPIIPTKKKMSSQKFCSLIVYLQTVVFEKKTSFFKFFYDIRKSNVVQTV